MTNVIYTKVKHVEYMKLVEKCETLEKENAKLKAELKKTTVKSEKAAETAETKKGGNK